MKTSDKFSLYYLGLRQEVGLVASDSNISYIYIGVFVFKLTSAANTVSNVFPIGAESNGGRSDWCSGRIVAQRGRTQFEGSNI